MNIDIDRLKELAEGAKRRDVPIITQVDARDRLHAALRPDAVLELIAEVERLRKREADLFDMLKRCERDVQRALRVANSDDVSLRQEHEALRSACEAIQQRAAGIAPPATVEESEG